jgi:TfoX/Sxy family transcriptional regulator of competence genes
MAWVKIPKDNHPLFMAALPDDPAIDVKHMFGGIAAMRNGHMMAGLWADSAIVKLGAPDHAALEAVGGVPFDPMSNGRVMADTLVLPTPEFRDRARLAGWIRKASSYVATLPEKKKAKKAAPEKAAAKAAPKKAPPKKAAPKKPAPKKPAPKKPAPRNAAPKKR